MFFNFGRFLATVKNTIFFIDHFQVTASAYGFLRNLRKFLEQIFLTVSMETFLDYAGDMKTF